MIMFGRKPTSSKKSPAKERGDKYKTKYHDLKNYCRFMVYENAASCDQVTYLQEKILHIKEENSFLIRKLKHFEFLKNNSVNDTGSCIDVTKKLKRKGPLFPNTEQSTTTKSPVKLKKQFTKSRKKQTLSVSEEACAGQIVFPISLGDDLTIQCLGEIVSDRAAYHTEDIIFPVGYTATKVFGSIRNPRLKCTYTCRISDNGMFPRFEIISEDGLIFTGSKPDECHQKILLLINKHYSAKVVNDSITCGADFFGLTNPTVHYLILSLPGISKCVKYSFKRFNERISAKEDILVKDDIEACTSYSALLKVLPDTFDRDHFTSNVWLSA